MSPPDTGGSGCDCIRDVNEKLADRNVELLVTFYPLTRPIIETQKIDTKKRGKPPLVIATFCPFCGLKFPKVPTHG